MTVHEVVAEIRELYESKGRRAYGEQVSLLDHSLLTAATAEAEGADEALVVAALLHDIGHLLVPPDDEYGKHTHDRIGGDWLAARFPDEVAGPVRLHVDAKRYLCGADPSYVEALSPASRYTLDQQGGPFSGEELTEFLTQPHAEAAIRLRRWEDAFGKIGDRPVPPFDRFTPLIERLATR